jgi:hypothetical protein
VQAALAEQARQMAVLLDDSRAQFAAAGADATAS